MTNFWKGGVLLVLLLLSTMSVAAAPDPAAALDMAQAEESTSADVRVIPRDGEQGSNHTILVSGLQASENITIRVLYGTPSESVYTTNETADSNGRVELTIFTTDGDDPGVYTVEVLNRSDDVIGSAEFTVLEPQGRMGSVSVSPGNADAGSTFTLEITEARPFASLDVVVRDAELVPVFRTSIRADVDGMATVEFPSERSFSGDYSVTVNEGEFLIAEADFEISAVEQLVEITIRPEEAEEGETLAVSVSGLEPETEAQLVITFAGAEVISETVTADVNGNVIYTFATEDAAAGEYTVTISQDEEALAEASYAIVGDAVRIVAQNAVVGETLLLSVTGLDADESVTVELLQDGDVLEGFPATADVNGNVILRIPGESLTASGTYDVRVVRDEQPIASTSVIVASAEVASDVIISTTRQALTIGDSFVVNVSGLEGGETVTFEVRYDGETVYSTERTADDSGAFSIELRSEESDDPGQYELVVVRDGEDAGSALLTIAAAEQGDSEVTVAAVPDTVAAGESFTLTVEGLEPGETVTVDLLYDDASVYTTERVADEDGSVTLRLTAEESDQPGEYEVIVTRNGDEIAAGGFAISETTTQVAPEDVTVEIEPDTFAQGEGFTVTVSGLAAEETVEVDVRYDGESVFLTERTADADGVIELALTSSADDDAGDYEVVVLRDGDEVAAGTFAIAGDEEGEEEAPEDTVNVVVDPNTSEQGDDITVTISELEPGETVTVDILFDGDSVFETERTADDNGRITLQLTSTEEDQAGRYVVVVERDGSQVGAGSFTVTLPGEETPPEEVTEVEITIEPTSGPLGTTHNVTVTGLEPGETVELEVLFDDQVDFSGEVVADEDGTVVVPLVGEEGDAPGDYTVNIKRGDRIVASGVITIEDAQEQEGEPDGEEPEEEPAETTVVTGNLTDEMPEEEITFSGEEGDTVVISLSSEDFDTYLILLDEDGEELAVNDDSNNSLNSEIGPFELPYSGEYTIVVSSFGYSNFGDAVEGEYELEVAGVAITESGSEGETGDEEPEDEPEEPGDETTSQIITGRLTDEMPEEEITFSGEEGDTVLISLNSTDFDTYLFLLDENGTELELNDDSNNSLNSQIGPYTLPYSGEYTVVVSSYNYVNFSETTVGDYELIIERVGLSEIAYGETVDVTITEDSFTQFFSFEAAAGDVISVDVDSNESIDTVLSIVDPSGFTVLTDDDGGEGFDPEVIRYVVPTSGTYTLTLRAFTPGTTGTAALTINLDDRRTLDEESRTVVLNAKQNRDVLTLTGEAGEAIQLRIAVENGEPGDLNISATQDGQTLMYYQSFGIPSEIVLGFVLPQDGEVTIFIDELSGAASILDVSIERE